MESTDTTQAKASDSASNGQGDGSASTRRKLSEQQEQ